MSHPVFSIAVIMERRSLANRWQAQAWEAIGIIPDPGDAATPRVLLQDQTRTQWLHGGFGLKLHRDEAENYYLNLSARQPCVFVTWRTEEDLAVPKFVTVSYGEAARFMDANGPAPVEQKMRSAGSSARWTEAGPARRSSASTRGCVE